MKMVVSIRARGFGITPMVKGFKFLKMEIYNMDFGIMAPLLWSSARKHSKINKNIMITGSTR